MAGTAEDMVDGAGSKLGRVFTALDTLVGAALRWLRVVVITAALLALVNAALFLLPRRDEPPFLFGAVVLTAILMLPALALAVLGRRIAALRDGLVTIGQRLPELTTLPRSVYDGFTDLPSDLASKERARLPRRLIGTSRSLVRASKLVRSVVDEHKELFSASTTVVTYGPRDLLLAWYGALGVVGLSLAVPVFALWAVLA